MRNICASFDVGWSITRPNTDAGVPEEYAALTIAFPPVAKIKFVSLFFINSLVACMVGVLMTETQPSGAPAAIAAFG